MIPVPGKRVRGSRTGKPIMAFLDLIGRRWALRILWELRGGSLGFRPPAPLAILPLSASILSEMVNHQPGSGHSVQPLQFRGLPPLIFEGPDRIVGSFGGFEKQPPQLPFAHPLADLNEREVKGKDDRYSQCPDQDLISSCVLQPVSEGRVKVVNFVFRLQQSFNTQEQQTGDRVEKHLDRDRDNPAIMLKGACERRLVKYERRFGSQQGANYRVGKYRYLNRELRERQLDERNQEQESDKKKEEDRPGGEELFA